MKQLAPTYGIEVVFEEYYPSDISDFTPQVLKIKGAQPDALLIVALTPQHLLFQKAYETNQLDLPYGLWSWGQGAGDATFYKSVNMRAVEYMFVQEDLDLSYLKRDWVIPLNDAFKAKMGYDLTASGVQGLADIYIIADALQRAGSTDREAVRNALAATNITEGPAMISGYPIVFDENGQNTQAHKWVSQVLKGERRMVFPEANAEKDVQVVWPIPSWSQR
jgi:branched-chain amino acid transport system substrate-binding protein